MWLRIFISKVRAAMLRGHSGRANKRRPTLMAPRQGAHQHCLLSLWSSNGPCRIEGACSTACGAALCCNGKAAARTFSASRKAPQPTPRRADARHITGPSQRAQWNFPSWSPGGAFAHHRYTVHDSLQSCFAISAVGQWSKTHVSYCTAHTSDWATHSHSGDCIHQRVLLPWHEQCLTRAAEAAIPVAERANHDSVEAAIASNLPGAGHGIHMPCFEQPPAGNMVLQWLGCFKHLLRAIASSGLRQLRTVSCNWSINVYSLSQALSQCRLQLLSSPGVLAAALCKHPHNLTLAAPPMGPGTGPAAATEVGAGGAAGASRSQQQ